LWKEERPSKSLLASEKMVDLEGGECSRGKTNPSVVTQ
jgi:hypothetical protein